MPEPSYSLRPCRRSKGSKMRWRYFSSKPIPLSATRSSTQGRPPRVSTSPQTRTTGGTPGRWNLMAFPIRFCSSWPSWVRSPSSSVSSPSSTRPLLRARLTSRSEITSRDTCYRFTGTKGWDLVETSG